MNKWLKIILAAIVVVGIRGSDIRAGARIDFSSQNQTYDWLADYRQTRTGAKFEFKTYFIAQSNLIKGPLKRWQENATLGFGYNYKLLDNIQLITGSDYTVNGLENRRVRTSGLKAGISFRPTKYLDFQPTLRADNKRKTEDAKITVDQGIGYGMKISLNDPLSRLANIEAFVSYDNENLSHIPSDEGSGLIRTS